MNWRGRPLEGHEAVVELIGATTSTGLTVHAELDPGAYPKGIKVTDSQLAAVPLHRHPFHGEWNYTIAPEPLSQPRELQPYRAVCPNRGERLRQQAVGVYRVWLSSQLGLVVNREGIAWSAVSMRVSLTVCWLPQRSTIAGHANDSGQRQGAATLRGIGCYPASPTACLSPSASLASASRMSSARELIPSFRNTLRRW
jgi:Rhodopirellula transposase DDE domain